MVTCTTTFPLLGASSFKGALLSLNGAVTLHRNILNVHKGLIEHATLNIANMQRIS